MFLFLLSKDTPIAAVILFVKSNIKCYSERPCQHVVSPGWSSVYKSLEISGAPAVIL